MNGKPKRRGLSAFMLMLVVASTQAEVLYSNGLALHLDAGRIFGVADETSLTRWSDASGNGCDAVAGTPPTYLADGGGGYPAVRFDGTNDYLETSLPTGTDASVFIVYANRRDPLLVQHSDTLLSSSATGDKIDLSASRYVDGEHIVQFGWDKNSLFDADYQAQIGADEIIQWNAVDSMDGGTWYNGGTLPDFDDADIGASLESPTYDVVMTSRAISSTASDHTNTIVNSDGKRLGLGPVGGSDIYFRGNEASAWTFDFDRDVELRQIMFDAMGNASDRVRISIAGGGVYVLDRDDCAETSAWSGDGSMEVHTFPTPVSLTAGTDVTVEVADSPNPGNNNWQLAGVIVAVPAPAPDYPGFVAQEAAGVSVSTWVNGRSTAEAGTDIFRDRYSIGSAVYSQLPDATTLTLGAQAGGGSFGQNDIREILVYDHALSESNRNAVLAYLGDKYRIEVINRPLDHPVETYNHILGAQQIGRQYNFGESGVQVLDAARALVRQGSRGFKMALSEKYAYQNGVQDNPAIDSLTKVVRDEPSIRTVLDMPFTDILFWASTFSVPKWGQVATSTGLDAATEQLIYDEIYDFTVYLLTNYNGSGKSFYIGNWEGDWLLAGSGSQDPENDITIAKINGMIDWATVRQQAIDDAKAATPHTNVDVWYYLEMNRGDWAVDGRPCVVNSVMPNLSKLDFVSFSSWSIKRYDESDTHAVLDVIQNALPTNSPPPGSRLILGEYGYAQQTMTRQQQTRQYLDKIGHYLSWTNGPPRFILMWEFFWNERGGSGNWKNMHQITEDNECHPLYYLHENYFRDMRRWVEAYYDTHGSVPSRSAYAAEAAVLLNTISLVEYIPELGSPKSLLIQFGGGSGNISNANHRSQINADQIIQWNGVNSWGGSFGANGTLNNKGVGATLFSSNSALTLTSQMISSTDVAGINTFSSGSPNVLGIKGGDNAKFDVSNSEAWTLDFDQDITLKHIIVSAVDGNLDMPTITVEGVTRFAMTRDAFESSAVTWDPVTKRYVWTFAGGGIDVPAGTNITLSAGTGGAWGLQGIVVEVDAPSSLFGLLYSEWVDSYPSLGSETNLLDNPDGDDLDNLAEYAVGGDPTDPDDQGNVPVFQTLENGGSNVFDYVYFKRIDAVARGLTYEVELSDSLTSAAWTNTGYTVIDGTVSDGFQSITNRVPMVDPEQFIQLLIEH